MKKTIPILVFLFAVLSGYSQQKKDTTSKPFIAILNEVEANRIYYILSQVKVVLPKSKMPIDEALVMMNNTDTAMMVLNAQYMAWVQKNKKDSVGKK